MVSAHLVLLPIVAVTNDHHHHERLCGHRGRPLEGELAPPYGVFRMQCPAPCACSSLVLTLLPSPIHELMMHDNRCGSGHRRGVPLQVLASVAAVHPCSMQRQVGLAKCMHKYSLVLVATLADTGVWCMSYTL